MLTLTGRHVGGFHDDRATPDGIVTGRVGFNDPPGLVSDASQTFRQSGYGNRGTPVTVIGGLIDRW